VADKADEISKDDVDRKASRSKLLKAPIRVRTQDGEHDDEFTDYFLEVDKDRVYIKTEDPFEVGTVVHLGLTLPGISRPIHFRGEVVRINPHKPAGPEDLDAGMGIVFERVSYDDRRLINDYLEKIGSEDRSEDYSMFLSWVSKISRPMNSKERERVKKDLLKALYGTGKDRRPVPTARRRKSSEELEFISKVPLFEDMDEIEIEETARIMVREEFRTGDAVFDEGDVGDKMYVIVKGAVDIIKGAGRGTPGQILVTLRAGDYFGEMSLIDDAPRSASVMATEDSLLFSMDKKDLSLLLDNAPSIAAKIYKFFVITLNQRLRETNDKIKTFVNMAQEMSQS